MHWRRGVTNIILWIYVYGYFLSPPHAFCLRRVSMFSSFFLCCPAHRPPTVFVFRLLIFFVDIVFMPSFVPIVTTNLCLFPHSFKVPFPSVVVSLSCFFSSCHVANLTHHLIKNRDDSGGELSLPAFARVIFAVSPKARETTLIIH